MNNPRSEILELETSNRVRALEEDCPGVLSVVRLVVQGTIAAEILAEAPIGDLKRVTGYGHEMLRGLGLSAAVDRLIEEGILRVDSDRVVLQPVESSFVLVVPIVQD